MSLVLDNSGLPRGEEVLIADASLELRPGWPPGETIDDDTLIKSWPSTPPKTA